MGTREKVRSPRSDLFSADIISWRSTQWLLHFSLDQSHGQSNHLTLTSLEARMGKKKNFKKIRPMKLFLFEFNSEILVMGTL